MKKNSQKKERLSLSLYVRAYIPAMIWAGIIFTLSAQSSLQGFDISTLDFLFKKSAHMFVYFVLYLLLLHAAQETHLSKSKLIWLPIMLCFIYAISDEVHQSFVPGRFSTIRDIGFDTIGMSIGFLKSYNYI